MATQPERITALEVKVGNLQKAHSGGVSFAVFKWAVAGAVLWLGFLTTMVVAMHGDLKAIKQSIRDHGLGDIVSQIENPASSQQLSATLGLVSSQIKVQQANGTKPDSKKLDQLSAAVRKAALKEPQNPAVWQTAYQLVNYRSEGKPLRDSSLPDCFSVSSDVALRQLANTTDEQISQIKPLMYTLRDCTLNLDATSSYSQSLAQKFFDEANRRNPGNGNIIFVANAKIIYSGGPIIPVNKIVFRNCVFDFSLPEATPPKSAQAIADQLLTADLSNAVVTLPSGL